jgi:hypothetical protein
MPQRTRFSKPIKRGLGAGLLAVVVLVGAAACKRGGGSATAPGSHAPSVNRLPRAAGPTTAAMEKENREKILAGLYLLEPLTNGVTEIAPDGETWTRFTNGLMIHDLRRGPEGFTPRLGQAVTITYVGTLSGSGKVFDRRDAGNPFTFIMGSKDLIRGFSLGISTMRVGGKRRIFVPADLGYGPAGNPRGGIGGDQALIFEVELLNVTGDAVDYQVQDIVPTPEVLGPPAPKSAAGGAIGPSSVPAAGTQP